MPENMPEKKHPAVNLTLLLSAALLAFTMSAAKGFAQTPPQPQQNRGFTPPGSNFGGGNPFAGGRAGGADFFDEDEEDEDIEDISDEILRQRMEQRLRERSQFAKPAQTPAPLSGGSQSGGAGGVDMGSAGTSVGATSLAGGANTKITPGGKGPNCLRLDPDTGYGPDIVTNFDFPDADIVEIAKTLGRLTCVNFMFDKDVRGKISIVSNSPITVGDAWKAFLTSMDVNGFSLIPSGKYYRIARQRDAKDKQIKTYSGEASPDNDMYITRVIPLKYISAEEVSRVFRNFMPPNTRIISYDQTNTIIITDTGSNIKKVTDMLDVLDVETYDEKLDVIRIKYASAQDISKLIDQLLPGGGAGGGAPAGAVPRFRGGFAARRTKEGGAISHIIPDDRTNSVIVSANQKGQEQVRQLIQKLDRKVSASAGGSKIHVIYLQFADAEQVSQTINNLASGAGPRPASPGGASAPTALFEGAIKIAADKPTNSLVITGSPSDFQTVARVISKLDVPRDQVYVEAIIMEMTVDKTFELGTSLASPTNGVGFLPTGDLGSFLVNPLSVNGLVMGFSGGKSSKTFTLPGSTQSVTVSSITGLIKALQTNSNANVLSTPQLLTLDNQEATIEVAETIPVPVVTAVGASGTTQQSVTREKIALNLTIKPQINKISSFVKLDINQKLEDISNRTPPKAVADQALGTLSRTSKTTVVVQDGDTVALGGLVRDKVLENAVKVPLLGDIPVIGWLFRSKTTNTAKQNLISFITPRIVKQYQQIRKVLDRKIRERDEFIEKNLGGEDEFQEQKMRMIKDLPALSELKEGGRVESGDIETAEAEVEEDDQVRVKVEPLAPKATAPADAPAAPSTGTPTREGQPKPAPVPAAGTNPKG
ncbi:MAG: type II secretion system secretin GspD [Deltaproteobacteria bacterium]|nr:type II secretion system secretin GspD [Deltaproteobacteria bacterium]